MERIEQFSIKKVSFGKTQVKTDSHLSLLDRHHLAAMAKSSKMPFIAR